MSDTPQKLGFRMPAEWEPHSAIWLAWPYDKIDFPSGVEKVGQIYIKVIKDIHSHEDVCLLVIDTEMQNKVINMLQTSGVNLSKINFFVIDYFSFWIRDTAPSFLLNQKTKEKAVTKWVFND